MQHALDTEQYTFNGTRGCPIFSKQVETNVAIGVDVWMQWNGRGCIVDKYPRRGIDGVVISNGHLKIVVIGIKIVIVDVDLE